MAKNKKDSHCFWCEKFIVSSCVTRDHLIPLGMGGSKDNKIVPSCRACNEERGKVTELYSDRVHMVRNCQRNPERATSYKNKFRKKVRTMAPKIIKWEYLHRQRHVILPYSMMEIVRLDEIAPIGV